MPDELHRPPLDAAIWQRIALAALGLALTALGVYILQGFLRALAWGGIFALAVWPLYCRARRGWPGRKHDIVLPAIFTLAITLVFLVPLVAVGIEIGREGASVVRLALEYQRTGIPLPDFVGNLPVGHQALADWWQANLSDPANLSSLVGRINRDHALAYSESVGMRVLHQGVTFVFTLLMLFFLLRDGDAINVQLHRAVTRAFGARGAIMCAQATTSVRATVDGLRADIKKNLEREVKFRLLARNKNAVMDALVANAELDLPNASVQSEIARMVEGARAELKQRGIKDADNAPIPDDVFRPQAERRVRLGLVVAELVRANELQAKPEQIKAHVDELAASYEKPADVVRWYFSDANRLAEVEAVVIENNVTDFVLSKAKVEEKAVSFDELMAQQG